MTKPTVLENRLAQLMLRLLKLRLGEMPRLDVDLTFSQMELMGYVNHSPNCHVQDIADGLELTPPTVSVAVRRLEEAGWLERQPDPQDGRAFIISLTSESIEMLQRANSARGKGIRKFLIGLAPNEQEQLINLLEKAIKAAELRKHEA
jgi:DNA-binding MarR family transcriptional regulator